MYLKHFVISLGYVFSVTHFLTVELTEQRLHCQPKYCSIVYIYTCKCMYIYICIDTKCTKAELTLIISAQSYVCMPSDILVINIHLCKSIRAISCVFIGDVGFL